MADTTTKTARRRLERSSTVQWSRLGGGRSLGYRRPTEAAGAWFVRVREGGTYRVAKIGTADDIAEAIETDENPRDAEAVISYRQAAARAAAWEPEPEHVETSAATLTVGEAIGRYLDWYRIHRKAADRAEAIVRAHMGPLLDLRVCDLTPDRVRSWHQAIAASPRRLRGGQTRAATTPDQLRARKATANRALTVLKAALTKAYDDGLAESDAAWTRAKPFRGADAARVRYLGHEEIRRLLNACAPDFRDLVSAALLTGCRYGELVALKVEDFRREAGAIQVRESKSGKPRAVYLGADGVALFERLTTGRPGSALMLTRADGEPWGRNHQARRLAEASAAAQLAEPVSFHSLRHSYASLTLMSGGALVAVAKQLGHSDSRMVERHYGHLADQWRAEEATKHAPSLGIEPGNVRQLRRKAR